MGRTCRSCGRPRRAWRPGWTSPWTRSRICVSRWTRPAACCFPRRPPAPTWSATSPWVRTGWASRSPPSPRSPAPRPRHLRLDGALGARGQRGRVGRAGRQGHGHAQEDPRVVEARVTGETETRLTENVSAQVTEHIEIAVTEGFDARVNEAELQATPK